MMRGTLRSTAHLVGWTAGLLVTGRLLYGMGSDGLRIPLTSLTDLGTWLADTPPPTMAMAVVRLAALAAIAYLLAATVLAVAAGLIRAKPLEAAARRLTPAVVRRMATGGGGVGLALGTALGAVPSPDLGPHPVIATGAIGSPEADLAPAPPKVATMTRHEPHVATMTRTADPPAPGAASASDATAPSPGDERGAPGPAAAGDSSGPGETSAIPGPGAPSSGRAGATGGAAPPAGDLAATLAAVGGASTPTRVGDGSGPAQARRTVRAGPAADTPGPSPPAVGVAGGPTGADGLPPLTATMVRTDGSPVPGVGSGTSPPLPQPGNTWVVGPGDSFWSIAEDVIAPSGGGPPSERAVGRYWRRLIDANRAELIDPGNPDVLVPGQELVLPPP
jgi:hypothetical protein